VPYKGSDRATQDLIGGQVMVGFVGAPIALPHLKSGRLRALGVSTAKRSPQMPDVPTLAEAGVPGYEATIWIGLFAPTGTPPEILARLQRDIARALAAPEARAQIASTGVDVSIAGAEDFGAFVRAEHAKWGKVVRDTGATVN
jgi:tripartite-type tricarboxylate transporter receptor subunit TctC